MSRVADARALLGVTEDATQAEVRAAYKRLAHELHPDKNAADPAATEKFQALHAAFSLVMSLAPTARACAKCYGAGRIEVRRGFFAITQTCKECGGSGKEKPREG